jgi:hypothetical protein
MLLTPAIVGLLRYGDLLTDFRHGLAPSDPNSRRRNLRTCTPRQNACNRAPAGAGSRFAGVYPASEKWGSKISHKGTEYLLGLFDDEREAALARDRMALELHGKFAWLNLPEEIYEHPPGAIGITAGVNARWAVAQSVCVVRPDTRGSRMRQRVVPSRPHPVGKLRGLPVDGILIPHKDNLFADKHTPTVYARENAARSVVSAAGAA